MSHVTPQWHPDWKLHCGTATRIRPRYSDSDSDWDWDAGLLFVFATDEHFLISMGCRRTNEAFPRVIIGIHGDIHTYRWIWELGCRLALNYELWVKCVGNRKEFPVVQWLCGCHLCPARFPHSHFDLHAPVIRWTFLTWLIEQSGWCERIREMNLMKSCWPVSGCSQNFICRGMYICICISISYIRISHFR